KGQAIRSMQGLKATHFNLHYTPDGTRLVSARMFQSWGDVIVLDVATGRESFSVKFDEMQIMSIRISPDVKRLAVIGALDRYGSAEARILDLANGHEVLPPLKGHAAPILASAFSPDGKRLATSGVDQTVKIWDLETGQETLTLKGHPAVFTSVEF